MFASATQYEGFGMPLIEANACGKAVIAFRKAAIPYVVKHGETGLLAKNFKQFKGYIQLLLEDKQLREKTGRNAAQVIRQKYTWRKVAEEYIDLFQHC